MANELDIERVCFPLYLLQREPPGGPPLHFYGTCFVLPGGVVVTCKHCVRLELEDGTYLGIAEKLTGSFRAHELFDVSADPSGADLATARVNWELSSPLFIADGAEGIGYDVATFGYPGTHFRMTGLMSETKTFVQSNRLVKGYVSRDFLYENPNQPGRRMWEVDLPAVVGASGGPLLWRNPIVKPVVLGVVCGSIPEKRESYNDGKILPEYIFGIAEHWLTLAALRGKALGDKTLLEYMAARGRVAREKK